MKTGAPASFGAQLKTLREAAGYTQEELATIAGLSVHAVSALERGERRRPHVETVRALAAAFDLTGAARDALLGSARTPAQDAAVDELSGAPLPLPLTALLGRDADMQVLRRWLADPATRLVTLVGPGGVGKTRLALELARAIAGEGTSRVVFATLAAVRNPAFVAPAIAKALGLSDVAADDLPAHMRIACEGRPTLLVIDNFEHLQLAAPLLVNLLTSVAPLCLLVTSREPLHVRGEREYAVGPLALDPDCGAMAPADLARIPAVRLFVERVRDVRPDFRLSPANGPSVAAICRRLDALPLALELAAPWLKVLTPEDLLRRLGNDLLLSTRGLPDLPERHRTMSGAVGWSYQLLNPKEQRAFRRLSVLPDRFPMEAAAEVLAGSEDPSIQGDDALEAVAGLLDKSLLLHGETSIASRPLYRMLETVRAYAALELASAEERESALEGLARYYVAEASLAATGLVGPGQADWLNRVHDDLESYRGALSWLIERGRSEEAAAVAWGLELFWLIRGHAAEGLRWYEQILSLPSLPPVAKSRALLGTAVMCHTQGELGRSRTGVTQALAIAESTGDLELVAQIENMFGHVEHAGGALEAARARFARALEGFRAHRTPWGTGNALSGMAGVAVAAGKFDEAQRLLEEATEVLRHAGPWFLSLALYVRAIVAVRRGSANEAIALVRESLTRSRELQDRFAFVYALLPLAAAAVLKGDDAWAARVLGARDAVTERIGATLVVKMMHDLQERAEREVRARLGPKRWASAYAAGRSASFDALLRDIDNASR